ncbi:sirohydrochlorin chelatase [Acidovorax sp.]|uniref:sirohydrochlorin chelatase n=1 Tax=Acidovorax sp. TaxID=1872122 RepID=UPI0039E67B7E
MLAHGSRDPLWRAPIEAVAEHIRTTQPHAAVHCAYMELCPPTLPEAAAALVDGGAASITVVPLFLGMGKHAREDLPRLVQALRAAHPGVAFSVRPAVGEDERVIALLARMATE